MSYRVEWLLENRIILVALIDEHPAEDARQASDEIVQLFEASSHPYVHLLVDLSELTSFPKPIALIQNSPFLQHEKLRWFVPFAPPNPALSFVGKIVVQFMKTRTHIANNFRTALAFLNEMDETLPTLHKPIV